MGLDKYAFDDANRLKAVVSKTAAGVAQGKTEFVYDGLSRLRTSKMFTWANGAWQEQSAKARVYDGMNAIQERDGQGMLLALYIRGADMGGGIGGLLARVFNLGASFMHYDGRGNVVQLTDAAGAVSGKYTYDAYGNTLSLTGGAAGLNPYRFSTKEQVGPLLYYGYRFYSPSLGKWINRDPIREAGGANLYQFVLGNPLTYIDKEGLLSAGAVAALWACGVGATAGLLNSIREGWESWTNNCGAFSWERVGASTLLGCVFGAITAAVDATLLAIALVPAVPVGGKIALAIAMGIFTAFMGDLFGKSVDYFAGKKCSTPALAYNGPLGRPGVFLSELPNAAKEVANEVRRKLGF